MAEEQKVNPFSCGWKTVFFGFFQFFLKYRKAIEYNTASVHFNHLIIYMERGLKNRLRRISCYPYDVEHPQSGRNMSSMQMWWFDAIVSVYLFPAVFRQDGNYRIICFNIHLFSPWIKLHQRMYTQLPECVRKSLSPSESDETNSNRRRSSQQTSGASKAHHRVGSHDDADDDALTTANAADVASAPTAGNLQTGTFRIYDIMSDSASMAASAAPPFCQHPADATNSSHGKFGQLILSLFMRQRYTHVSV